MSAEVEIPREEERGVMAGWSGDGTLNLLTTEDT